MKTILLIDDSKFIRAVLKRMLSSVAEYKILGEASNGIEGFNSIKDLHPDIVILDVHMPIMSGLELLRELKKEPQRPRILLFSAHTKQHAQLTIECLLEGADDYICKPTNDPTLQTLRDELLAKLEQLHPYPIFSRYSPPITISNNILSPHVIGIAASTGGPDTIKNILCRIKPSNTIPILIVQHMPPLFTLRFAETLRRQTEHRIKEAKQHEKILPGDIIIARGGKHLILEKKGTHLYYRSISSPAIKGLRPSADILFQSLADQLGAKTLAFVLTGMGNDGLDGAKSIHHKGGEIIVQNKESSTVWGMPRAISESSIPARELSPKEIADTINHLTCSDGKNDEH